MDPVGDPQRFLGCRYYIRFNSSARYHANQPIANWQNSAPTSVIANPQSSIFRKTTRPSLELGNAAMQSAPMVDSGDTSTIAAPTLMLSAISSGLPPPSFSTSPGTAGRNAG